MELINVPELCTYPLFPSLVLLVSLLFWLKLATRKKLNLPPSPPKLPIIGNIHQFGKLPHHSLRDLSRKYGSLMLLQLGQIPTLVVSSSEIVREIVKNHDIVFSNRPKTTALDILLYGCTGVLAPYGEYWRQVRKVIGLELLRHQKVQSFQFVRDEEVEVLINKIRCASVNGESIDLTKMLMAASNNIVSRCVLSHTISDEDGSNKFGQLGRRMKVLMGGFCVGDMFPYLKWLDVLTGFIPSLKSLFGEMDTFLDQIIEKHRALTSQDEVTNTKEDFVSVILELQKGGMLEIEHTQDNIKAILLEMILGGSDTTSSTVEWMMTELLRHPNVMKKVQEEIRDVVGNKSKIEVDDISKMEYLKCVLKEIFRLHPVAPLMGPRLTSASVKVGGYDIPSHVHVLVNVWAIQRDPSSWEKPEEFIPERFENSLVDFKGQDFQFIPFGVGRRSCPGMQFGVASIECLIANLLYWFDWKLPADEIAENLDMSEQFGLTVKKKIPLHVLPISHLFT